ncbi:uncharacterized protein LOC105383819 isoform X1 [Plutella xylostella]|uniref:uncharacterized protein LOC105383819 isoform X1 n=1 Tax=Plutella xylostella TaxID=51655 RepID=UPI00203260E5|nr:uncharacterized protein LOC105383819 isoform X1 [Plutella xylostella]
MLGIVVAVLVLCSVAAVPYPEFETKSYKIGIEYEHSLPMSAGADRFRHRNNYDPFFITVTARAKKGYVLDYLEVDVTADLGAEIDFCLTYGRVGGQSMVFQISANQSDFINYTYRAYGIREADFDKITNVIILPMPAGGPKLRIHTSSFIFLLILPLLRYYIL